MTAPIAFTFSGFIIRTIVPISVSSSRVDFIGESTINYCQAIEPSGFEYHPSYKVDFMCSERTL